MSVTVADAAEYRGYVPESMVEAGETWPGLDAAGILACKKSSVRQISNLNEDAARKFHGMCSKAKNIHNQLISGACFQDRLVATCRVAISADNAIRSDPGFLHILNALGGKPDDYNLQ